MSRPEILVEREKTHGSFKHHASNTQAMKSVLYNARGKATAPFQSLCPEHREALEMIVHKIGRILAGNPNIEDHWIDIAGYATLGVEACKKNEQ